MIGRQMLRRWAVLFLCAQCKVAGLLIGGILPQAKQKVKAAAKHTARNIQRIFWPNTLPDNAVDAPLPPGPFGCPFKGFDPKLSSPSFGPGLLFFQLSKRLGHPRVWKFYSRGKGIAIVSGYSAAKTVMTQEFDTVTSQLIPFTAKVIGNRSLRYTTDRAEHSRLRRLVGMAMSPTAVSKLIPKLQETSEFICDSMLDRDGDPVQMEDVCTMFTLNVACKLILGLGDAISTKEDEARFREQVQKWTLGLYAAPDDDQWVDAREYLIEKIEGKLARLEETGPDDSTLSGMLFAQDLEDPNRRRLTIEEIIHNTLLLIFAGTETSSGTLANCMLLLGLHPQSWLKVVNEQCSIMAEYGPRLNRTALDASVYLDSVIRESLRLKPIVGGSMRGTTSTVVVEGHQIPAGWGVIYDRYLTHLLDPRTSEKDGLNMDIRYGFKPERWLDDSSRPGQDFLAFGVGPRYCIGADLAMVEMKCFLAILARRIPKFDLVYPNPEKPIQWRERSIVPIPAKGVVIQPQLTVP